MIFKRHITILVCTVCCALAVMAQDGTTAYEFLNVPVSSHVYALGGTNITIIDDDVNIVEQNPGLLGPEYEMQAGLNYMRYLGGSNFMGARFAAPAGERAAWAVGIQYFGYGSIDGVEHRKVVQTAYGAIIVQMRHERYLPAAYVAYVGNIGVLTLERRKCCVHDIGHMRLQRVPVNKSPANITVGQRTHNPPGIINGKKRHCTSRQPIKFLQGLKHRRALADCIIEYIYFVHKNSYLNISLTDAVKLNIKVVPPICGWANATPNPMDFTFSPAPTENPERKLRAYVVMSVRVL